MLFRKKKIKPKKFIIFMLNTLWLFVIKFKFKNLLPIVGFTLFNSCIITNTPGFYSGYKRLSADYKNKILIINDADSLQVSNDSITYAITAKHLMQLLKKSPKSIVYFWSPNCSGNACIPITSFQNYCMSNGYNPIIITEYYDFNMLSIQGVNPSSVFAINHWHYGTDYCNTYVRRFKESLFKLFNTELNKNSYSSYLYYNGQEISTIKPANLTKYPWQ